MSHALAFELAKLVRSRRSLLYVVVPNVYAISFTMLLPVAFAWASPGTRAVVALGLPAFVWVHELVNGLVIYPACALVLACQLWTSEAAEGTLSTLLITQVARWKVLVAKVLAIGALPVAGQVLFWALFLADSLFMGSVLRRDGAAGTLPIVLAGSAVNLAVYTAVFALGAVVLALFASWLALLSDRTSTVALLALVVLSALWFAGHGPVTVTWFSPEPVVFTHHLHRLVSASVVGPLILGDRGALAPLAPIAAGLAANGAVLALACLATLGRREL
jgi:hypothetical protein